MTHDILESALKQTLGHHSTAITKLCVSAFYLPQALHNSAAVNGTVHQQRDQDPPGIIGLVGVLNFINAVLTGILARKRELAMLQSVGMTGKQMNGTPTEGSGPPESEIRVLPPKPAGR